MLYRLIIGNFKSFAEEQQFDMFSNPHRKAFPNHIYNEDGVQILKEAAIYGANGSGKSNFVDALIFLKQYITESSNTNWDMSNWYLSNRYQLPVMSEGKPITMAVEYNADGKVFAYILEIDAQGVVTENLVNTLPVKDEQITIFARKRDEINFHTEISDDIKNVFVRNINSNPFVSVLALNKGFKLIDDKDLSLAADWFENQLDIVTVDRAVPYLLEYISKNNMLEFVNKLFSEIGLGIKKLDISETDFDEWMRQSYIGDKQALNVLKEKYPNKNLNISKMRGDVPEVSISESNGNKIVKEFIFNQLGKSGYVGEMKVNAQSNGTLRLLALIPAMYNAIYNKSTVVIDEIDNGIHPILTKNLIKFFGDTESKGQLIYTTHETVLLNQQELLRPDEVWLTQKVEGATKMYSLNEFKLHNTISIENGYLDGRYGAIPFIGDLE